jgi:ArsR family transcriptional regulator, cadmium/lead-responsive transcriptional repressor
MVMRDQKFAIIEEVAAAGTPLSSLSVLFHAFADSSRLSCLLALRERPRSVSEIASATGLSQPNVSKHLSRLRGCGLVHAERSGRFVSYGMADPGMEQLLDTADALLARIKGCSEQERGPR